MSIAVDCRFAGIRNAGIGRYTRELVRELTRINPDQEWILFVQSENEDWLKDIQGNIEAIEASIPHYSWKEQWAFRKMIKKSGARLLFSPHFNVPFFCPIPYVITIHDLILHWYPNQASFIKRFAYKLLLSRCIREAEKIIAVSKFTRDQLEHVYGKRAAKKTSVIYEGVSELFHLQSEDIQKRVCEKFGLQKPFFLYVGNAKEHKNVQMLLDAFEKTEDESKDLVLVSGGSEIKNLRIPKNVILIPNVSDDELPSLYSAATCFVTASLYEGFGLPVAEAQSCGCPVIASRTSAIPEVAGSDAVLLEPTKDNFVHALKNPPLRKNNISLEFSWKKAAEQTLKLLQSVIE